ncbi:MAG: acyl carrier protein, partial [Steroidobacteraceae bacterium]
LRPEQGLLALQRVAESSYAQVAVLPIQWPKYLYSTAGNIVPAFLSEVARTSATPATPVSKSTSPLRAAEVRSQVAAAPAARRRVIVAAFVREHAVRALGLDPAKPVDPRTPLGDLGLDSLLAVELRNTLGHALAASLPATLLFDYPTLDSLTDYLLQELLDATSGSETAGTGVNEGPSADTLVESIETMSDDEVDRLIAARARKA